MMGWGFTGMGFFWMLLWMLFWLAVLVGLIMLIARALSGFSRSGTRAREILDERLARGEITREEYQALKAELHR